MLRGPRWFHHLRARARHYFWLPCPVCGRYFGGHEWKASIDLRRFPLHWPSIPSTEPYRRHGVCSWECADKAAGRY